MYTNFLFEEGKSRFTFLFTFFFHFFISNDLQFCLYEFYNDNNILRFLINIYISNFILKNVKLPKHKICLKKRNKLITY